MSKDVIQVDGEDVVVREDVAKASRGVNWIFWTIGGFVVIAAILTALFFVGAVSDGNIGNPSETRNNNTSPQ